MTTQPQSRTTFPVRAFAIAGLAAVGIAIGLVAVYWYQASDESNETTNGTALAPWVRPAEPTAAEALAIEMAIHEAATEAQFGPVRSSGAASNAASQAIAEHDNAFPPLEIVPSIRVAPSVPSGQTFDEAMADAIAQHGNAFPPSNASTATTIVVAPSVPAGQTFDEAMADAVTRYGYPSPVSVNSTGAPIGSAFDEAMADGLAMYAALLIAFPPTTPTGNPYVADR